MHQDLEDERHAGPPASNDGAEHRVIDKNKRRRPDPYVEIKPRRAGDFGAGIECAKADPGDRRLEQNHCSSDANGDDQGADERRALLGGVAGAKGLRGEPRRPHAQKTETPEDKVENDGGGGDRAEKMRLAEPANNRRVGDAEQRRRQMGERHRQREPHHAGVAHARRIYAGVFCVGGHRTAARFSGRCAYS